ncbi:MAG TPA: sulfatase [Nocardioidaceae bacterium]|nr:sulfatase [Nocardioidaceae bacterium]
MHTTLRRLAAVVLLLVVVVAGCSADPHPNIPDTGKGQSRFGEPEHTAELTRRIDHLRLWLETDGLRTLQRPVAEPVDRPNIVLITTDDMTVGELRWMPQTRQLLGAAGVTFDDSISPHPLCCPARAEILTGQFAQNNGVRTNFPPHGGYQALDADETLPVWLSEAGYQTAFLGKYLNEYADVAPTVVPPGWSRWMASAGRVYDYNDFTLNIDGELHDFWGVNQSDLYGDLTEDLVPELARSGQPFFIWQSHVAPHSSCPRRPTVQQETCWRPPTPASRHQGSYDDVPLPSRDDPAFNEADVTDKPPRLRRPLLGRTEQHRLTQLFRRRIESLASVDDTVARTVAALEGADVLDETLIVFTSDNGFLLGEHRLRGKILGYEESLRVPLLMRGPGIPAGEHRQRTVATVDLAPTFVAAARARPGLALDGRHLMPVATQGRGGWDTILIQAGPRRSGSAYPWYYRGVRTGRYTYLRYTATGREELYDRRRDPHQLRNVASTPAYRAVLGDLRQRTRELRTCAGTSCRRAPQSDRDQLATES